MPPVIPLLVGGGVAAAGAAGGAGAIGGVAGLIGVTSVTTAAIVNAGVGTALVLGASYAMAKLSPAPRQPRPADGTVEYKSPLSPRFYSYGKCKVGGPVLFLEVSYTDFMGSGSTGEQWRLLKITAFGSREMAMMDPFYLDNRKVTLSAGTDGSDGRFTNWQAGGNNYGNLWTHLGRDTQAADANLIHDYPGGWTSAHRLRGIPYVYAQLESGDAAHFQEAFAGGEPNFSTVGGVKLYDPRKDSTNGGSGSHRKDNPDTWEWSDNQRLVGLDWITWKDGYNKSWDRIDWATWVPQIAMADENVPLKAGGTEKRYRIATIVSMAEPKGRVLRRIMDAGDQQLFTTNTGLIGSRGGVWQTPSVSLSAAEILEGQFTHGVGMMDRINEFQLTAMLPSHDYAEVELQPWSNTGDPEFAAGFLRSQPLDLTQVPSNSQAQRLAKIRMAKVNPRWSGSVRTNFAGLDALGEAAVNLSFDELDQPDGSFDGPFLVNGKIGFLPDRTGMTVSLSSIDPACYDWTVAEEQAPPPLPGYPFNSVAPVVSGTPAVGSVLSCTTGTWTMSPTSYVYQWRRDVTNIAGATASTYTLVSADDGAMISCVVTAINADGSASAVSNSLGPVTTPVLGGAGLLAGEANGFAADFTYATDSGRVAVKTAGSVVSSGISFFTSSGTSSKWVYNAAGVLVNVAAGTLPLDYDPVTHAARGLLVEPAATNLMTWSQDYTQMNVTAGSAVADNQTGPDGTSNADTFTENTATDFHGAYGGPLSGVTANIDYTISRFMKMGTRRYATIGWADGTNCAYAVYDLQSGTVGSSGAVGTGVKNSASIQALPNGWYRCILSGKVNSSAMYVNFGAANAATITPDGHGRQSFLGTGATLIMGGAQVESGLVATSYIPTTAASATRAGDKYNCTPASIGYSATAGSWWAETYLLGGAADEWIIGSSTAASALLYNVGGVVIRDGTQVYIPPGPSITNNSNKLMSAFAAGSRAVTYNGQAPATDAGAVSNILAQSYIGFGSSSGGTATMNGYLRKVRYLPRRPTNAEMQTMTT